MISATANFARWTTIRQNNPLSDRLATAGEHLANVASGRETGTTMLVGSPGVGKTHLVEAVCAQQRRGYMRIQSATELKLLEYLERCSLSGLLAVVDDADSLWATKKSVQMLLEATKPIDGRGRRRYKHGSTNGERTYNLDRLQMVILSNTDVRDDRSIARSVRSAMGALIDRSTVISLHADSDDIYYHACSLAILEGVFSHYSVGIQNDALRWFAENRFRVASPTVRTLGKAMRKRALYPSTWERHLAMGERLDGESTMLHLCEDDIPQVVPIPKALAA